MALSQETETTPFFGANATARPFPTDLLALKRYSQFYHFLRDELETCRTEAEKEVVLSALLTTQVWIHRLEKRLGVPWQAEA